MDSQWNKQLEMLEEYMRRHKQELEGEQQQNTINFKNWIEVKQQELKLKQRKYENIKWDKQLGMLEEYMQRHEQEQEQLNQNTFDFKEWIETQKRELERKHRDRQRRMQCNSMN
jgi:hypothetical protein